MESSLVDWIELYCRVAFGLAMFVLAEYGIRIIFVSFVTLSVWLGYRYIKKVRHHE